MATLELKLRNDLLGPKFASLKVEHGRDSSREVGSAGIAEWLVTTDRLALQCANNLIDVAAANGLDETRLRGQLLHIQ